jgi:ethanolamine utilization cobalamin adenosyltransferase
MMRTSLSGNRTVSKTDGRIRFRGLIDSLEAETIEAQVLANSLGEQYYCAALGELLDCLRRIMAAEVKGSPFTMPSLFGLSAEELRRQTHDVAGAFGLAVHPLPAYTQGPLAARLNTLRTRIREAELCALRVFAGDHGAGQSGPAGEAGAPRREDLAQALNRLSSAAYWLFCRALSPAPAPSGDPVG